MQYYPDIPKIFMVIAHVLWLMIHGNSDSFQCSFYMTKLGDTPIVYMVLNKTLRRAVLDLFGLKSTRNSVGNSPQMYIQGGNNQIILIKNLTIS